MFKIVRRRIYSDLTSSLNEEQDFVAGGCSEKAVIKKDIAKILTSYSNFIILASKLRLEFFLARAVIKMEANKNPLITSLQNINFTP